MQLTIQFLEENWEQFNRRYFQNQLNKPEFKISKNKRFLGQYHYDFKQGQFCDRITISGYYECDDFDYKNTLLHEMIHQYIRQNKLEPSHVHHGKVFMQFAKRFNKDGWNIKPKSSRKGYSTTNKNNTYYLCAFKDESGRCFLFRYNKNKYEYFYKKIMHARLGDIIWFNSTNDRKYDRLVACRSSIRGNYISNGEFKSLSIKTTRSIHQSWKKHRSG